MLAYPRASPILLRDLLPNKQALPYAAVFISARQCLSHDIDLLVLVVPSVSVACIDGLPKLFEDTPSLPPHPPNPPCLAATFSSSCATWVPLPPPPPLYTYMDYIYK